MRSFLFAPANRLDMIAKFPKIKADIFVLDLEDAVPATERAAARASLRAAVRMAQQGSRPHIVFVRINEVRSAEFPLDLQALAQSGADGVVLPKANHADDVQTLARAIAHTPLRRMVAGIESIAGVLNAVSIAAADGLIALYFGAEDFAVEMGARRTLDSMEVLHARSQVVMAAKAAHIAAVDQAVVQVRDDEQFRRDATRGRDLGFDGKICLLPRQVELANELFGPSQQEIEHATRLIAAYRSAQQAGHGAIDFEGKMVDEPVLKYAENILAAAAR